MSKIAPGWYGEDLASVIQGDHTFDKETDEILEDCGFVYKDFYQDQEYGSLDKIVRTYGFIFGKSVIEYLKRHTKTNIRWKWRICYKRVIK